MALGLFAVPLASPSDALAHEVNAEASSAECLLVDNVPTVTLTVKFEGSDFADHPVSGTIKLDGVVVKTYTDAPLTGSDSDFWLVYTQATTPGAHVIRGDFNWSTKRPENNGFVEKSVICPEAPSTPVTPETPTTPETPVVPSTPTPPGAGVLPETVASGLARLRGPSGCVKRTFPVRVIGRSIASVSFRLDGKLIKRFTSTRSTYVIKVKPRKYGFGRHRIIARVTFLTASGTKARRLPLTFRRCGRGTIAPRFTG
jgi:hypothetical protein